MMDQTSIGKALAKRKEIDSFLKRMETGNGKWDRRSQTTILSMSSVVTRPKLWEIGWEVLMHPPYSLDLAPSDYHLFLALQNFLSDKKLGSREDCENRFLF
ncbi:histone-lysine N-methyltransferase SETMAR [Trichonephila clavipes]|nr:histone-lysine N-methyltransferase SETMAR [Trichonephila clavipes]